MPPELQSTLQRRAGPTRPAPFADRQRCASTCEEAPFDEEGARLAAVTIEDAWNTRDPGRVVRACTEDCLWQCRGETLRGPEEIRRLLMRTWSREHDCRAVAEVWSWNGARIALRMVREWHDYTGNWFRSQANELWDFAADGRARRRIVRADDTVISRDARLFAWPQGPRPRDYPGLEELGL